MHSVRPIADNCYRQLTVGSRQAHKVGGCTLRFLAQLASSRFTFLLPLALLVLSSQSHAQPSAPFLAWPQPQPVPFLTPLSGIQLNAVAYAVPPVPVPLGSSYNIEGITTDGTPFNTGGFDGSSWAYREESLGSSILWHDLSFPLGAPNVPDAVYGATIPLPAGKFAALLLLGDLVNNEQPPTAHFTVTYTDGTTAGFTQNLSDWVNPLNWPGESLVKCAPSRHNSDGSIDPNSVCIYGYQFALDPTKTVSSLTLPNDRDVVILSAVLQPPIVPGTTTYNPASGTVPLPGTDLLQAHFVPADTASFTSADATVSLTVLPPSAPIVPAIDWPTPQPLPYGAPLTAAQLDASAATKIGPVLLPLNSSARIDAMYPDGMVFEEKGFDGTGAAFSANQLGTAVSYAGFTFPLGASSIPDAAANATLPLPPGQFAGLYFIGAAGSASAQLDQPFTVTYTDGTSTQTPVSLSSWRSPGSLAGETVVAQTTYANTPQGGQISGTFDLYGYRIALDATRTVQSLTLPPNASVILVAAGLDPGSNLPVQGNFVYTPPAGTVLPAFTPTDNADFAAATGATTQVVEQPILTLTAANATRLFGTPNPAFTGTIQGAIGNDTFVESFATSAGEITPAGHYPIVPSPAGPDLAR